MLGTCSGTCSISVVVDTDIQTWLWNPRSHVPRNNCLSYAYYWSCQCLIFWFPAFVHMYVREGQRERRCQNEISKLSRLIEKSAWKALYVFTLRQQNNFCLPLKQRPCRWVTYSLTLGVPSRQYLSLTTCDLATPQSITITLYQWKCLAFFGRAERELQYIQPSSLLAITQLRTYRLNVSASNRSYYGVDIVLG